MVAITATSYATPSPQATVSRARLQQARREADQAEANARQLREQAEQAEQQVQQGQGKVASLREQVAQADSTYSAQLRSKVDAADFKKVQQFLAPVATVARNNFSFPSNPLTSPIQLWEMADRKSASGRLIDQTV